MKTVTMRKTESNIITIDQPKTRMPRIVQRSATFKSGKSYNRKAGKRVD